MEGMWNPKAAFNKVGGPAPAEAATPVVAPGTTTVPVAEGTTTVPVAMPVTAPVVPVVATPVVAPLQVASSREEDEYAGVAKEIEIGEKSSRFPIEKFRGTRNQIKRVGVLTRKWQQVYAHYEKGMGNFYCFGGSCCETEKGQSKAKYLVPVIVYLNTDIKGDLPKDQNTGAPILGEFEIQYLSLAKENYDSICLVDQGFQLETIDLKVPCTDENYQKLNFIPAGAACWRSNMAFAKVVAEKYNASKGYILRDFARRLGKNEEECEANYQKRKSQIAQFGNQGGGNQFAGNQGGGHAAPAATYGGPSAGAGAPAAESNFNLDEYMNQ
jgi:hypothetical protein